MIYFTPKDPGETEIFTFDFTAALGTGESIITAAVACTVVSGVDAGAAAMVDGAAQIDGTLVVQKIQAGISGNRYTLIATVTTSAGQTLMLAGGLSIQSL